MDRQPRGILPILLLLFLGLVSSGTVNWAVAGPSTKERANAHIRLGIQYGKQGELDKAIAEFKRAVAINPENSAVYMNLGTAYATKGMFAEAIAAFEQATRRDPRSVKAHMNLGLAYFYAGKPAAALGAYQQALALDPKWIDAYRRMGQAYETQGKFEDAVAAYQKVRDARPRSAAAHSDLARAYLRARQEDRAIDAARRATELNPKLVEAHLHLATAYDQSSRLDDAARAYQQMLRLDPQLPVAHNRLGFVHLRAGRLEEAEAALQQAIKLETDFLEAHYNLAWVYMTQEKVDAAIAEYRRILQIDPEYAPAYAALGDAYDAKGMKAEAQQAYAKYEGLKAKVPIDFDVIRGGKSRLRVYRARPQAPAEKEGRQPFRLWDYRGEETAKDFSLPSLGGGTLSLSDFRGKVVALNFWATWCAPCVREIPQMEKLYQRYREQGFIILGISLDVDAKAAQAFMKELGATYPSVIDSRRQVSSQYRVWALPTTHFIDRQGKIIGWFYGERDWGGIAAHELIADLVAAGQPDGQGRRASSSGKE